MSDLKMVEIGTDKKGESLYNVRHKSGELVSTKALSMKEAEKNDARVYKKREY